MIFPAVAGALTLGLSLAIYGGVTVLLGSLALRLCIPTLSTSSRQALTGWAPAFLAGQLVLTTVLLLGGFLPLSLPGLGLLVLALAVTSAVRALRSRQGSRSRGAEVGTQASPSRDLHWAWISAGTLALLYPNVLFWILRRPVVDWDARSIWFFHARVLWIDRGLDPALFTDPTYLHSAYPLHLPAQGAWLSLLHDRLWGGGWSDVAAKSFLLLSFAAFFHLLWKLLRMRGLPVWLGLVASVAFFDYGMRAGIDGFGYAHVNGYADAHYIAPFLLALLAFSLPADRGGPALGCLLLAYGANVKLESGLYVLLLTVGAAGVAGMAWIHRRKGGSRSGVEVLRHGVHPALLLGVLLGGLPLGLWSLFRAVHGIRSAMDPLRWLTDLPAAIALLAERAPWILGYFRHHALARGAWALVAIWLGLLAFRWVRDGGSLRLDRVEWVGVAVTLTLPAVLLVIYGLTPMELDLHLRTSADRLLALPQALLYGLLLLALARSLSSAPSLRHRPAPREPRS